MCIDPGKISDVGFVACRKCWQCIENRIDDWVGRCVAESVTAVASHVVTLTYGYDLQTGDVDHIRAAVLTYSDVQKYLKLLRINGYPVRYFVTGEYGSKKGRAHWHIVLYWQKRVPEHVLKKNFAERHWPHGWSYWDKASPQAVRYACKYIQKNPEDDTLQSWGPMVSKKPPLGDAYFRTYAERYVQQGLAPQHLFYSFPDVKRNPIGYRAKTRKQYLEGAVPVRFCMQNTTAENFVGYYLDAWHKVHGTVPPKSRLLDKHNPTPKRRKAFEEWLQARDIDPLQIDADRRARLLNKYLDIFGFVPERPKYVGLVPVPTEPPTGGTSPVFDDKANHFFSVVGKVRLYYSTAKDGTLVWHEDIGPKNRTAPKRQVKSKRSREQLAMTPRKRAEQSAVLSGLSSQPSYKSLSKGH